LRARGEAAAVDARGVDHARVPEDDVAGPDAGNGRGSAMFLKGLNLKGNIHRIDPKFAS
jgi:hypothetical protein